MANAKKCDRCGDFYMEREITLFDNAIKTIAKAVQTIVSPNNKSVIQDRIETHIDVCPKCSKSLKMWLNEKEVETND